MSQSIVWLSFIILAFQNIPSITLTYGQETILQTLNKEQAIHWVKAERLPPFLNSELYSEYRLAKLVSQAKVTGEQGQHLLMKIDYKQHLKAKAEDVKQVVVNSEQELLGNMFVCMGNSSVTETEAWYMSAKMTSENTVSFSGLTGEWNSSCYRSTLMN